jgi:hypothetical protein
MPPSSDPRRSPSGLLSPTSPSCSPKSTASRAYSAAHGGIFSDLLAAARATLAADLDGEPDPLTYLRDAVAEHRAWAASSDGELAE